MSPSSLEKPSPTESQDLAAEKDKLRKATKQFESLFMYQMLQAMRKTVGENPLSKDGAFSDSFGKDTFMEMFDMHLAEKMSGNKRSISEILYNSLVKMIDPSLANVQPMGEVGSLSPSDHQALPLSKERPELESRPSRPAIPIKVRRLKALDRSAGPSQAAPDSIVARFGDIIEDAAAANKIDSALICAVIKTESGGNARAVSPAGAKGLMQLMDGTAAELGVTSVFDPHQNINSGSKYLAIQMDRFGDPRLAVAAYNAGPGNVARHGGIPPFPETEAYVDRVMEAYASYQQQMTGKEAKVASHSGR